jgi:hypothetical protein
MKRIVRSLVVPSTLAVGACTPIAPAMDAGTDGGLDAGPCPHSAPGNPMPASSIDDAGLRCGCEAGLNIDGGFGECCDEDIDDPCPLCCSNARDADGGRAFYADDGGFFYSYDIDAGRPVCLC